MPPLADVKICGIRDPATALAAAEAGAAYIGLNFFPTSPRAVSARQAAHIKASLPEPVQAVGLFVDPTDTELDDVLGIAALDMLQLHGAEAPERVMEIGRNYGLPVVKAMPVADFGDIRLARAYEDAADLLLFDARAATQCEPARRQRPDFRLAAAERYAVAEAVDAVRRPHARKRGRGDPRQPCENR